MIGSQLVTLGKWLMVANKWVISQCTLLCRCLRHIDRAINVFRAWKRAIYPETADIMLGRARKWWSPSTGASECCSNRWIPMLLDDSG